MRKIVFSIVIVMAFLLGAFFPLGVQAVNAKQDPRVLVPEELYEPALLKEEFAEAAEMAGAEIILDLTAQTPFWVDLVNKEKVSQDGTGVYVAVLDTGLLSTYANFFPGVNIAMDLCKGYTHDITYDATIDDLVIGPLRDDRGCITGYASGHGTHVTSTIVGYRYKTATADFWVDGVAPKATIIPVLVLDAWAVAVPDGTATFSGGTDEMISAGIMYIADLKAGQLADSPVVINMSLGGSTPSQMILDAINYAIDKGVVIVASAGNSGTLGMGYPGAFPQVISTAAGGWTEQWISKPPQTRWWLNDVIEKLNTKDLLGNNWQIFLEDFSSRPVMALGQKNQDLDVTAPGASILGPYKPAFGTTAAYYYLWGTSMSAPHVSSMAALVLQSKPNLNQAQVETILKKAATGLPMPSDGAIVYDTDLWLFKWLGGDSGAGFLQVDAAIK